MKTITIPTKADFEAWAADFLRREIKNAADDILRSMEMVRPPLGNNSVNDDDPVSVLMLSTRPRQCLMNSDVKTIGQLCAMNECELYRIREMGKKSVIEIKWKLGQAGRTLALP